jgi:hypothetical protein
MLLLKPLYRRDFGVTVAGCADTQARGVTLGCRVSSLQALTAIFMGFKISKSAQMSNWEAPTLSPAQVCGICGRNLRRHNPLHNLTVPTLADRLRSHGCVG